MLNYRTLRNVSFEFEKRQNVKAYQNNLLFMPEGVALMKLSLTELRERDMLFVSGIEPLDTPQ